MSDRGNAVIVEAPRYKKMKIICILEGACLETVKTKKVRNLCAAIICRDLHCSIPMTTLGY